MSAPWGSRTYTLNGLWALRAITILFLAAKCRRAIPPSSISLNWRIALLINHD
jgi:hypothetical protein